MGYTTKYSGPKIDDALSKANSIVERINGWTKVPSSIDSPVTLNDLVNPGNYAVDYWTDGPNCDLVSPANINVLIIAPSESGLSGKVQCFHYGGEYFTRIWDKENNTWGPWTLKQNKASVGIESTPPSEPSDKTIWIDTSDPEHPTYKMWSEEKQEFVIIKPATTMDTKVYDPNGMAQDIFAYIDQVIADANLETITTNFDEHIDDTEIHVTAEEQADWSSRPTKDEIDSSINKLQDKLEASVLSQASNLSATANQLHTEVLQYTSQVNMHVSDKTIHPNKEKMDYWDSKAEAHHTHFLDGKVTIAADQIVDGIIDPKLIDSSAREEVIKTANAAETRSLTTDDVQNGDMIYQQEGQIIYYVVDETYLNTDEYEKGLKVYASGVVVMSWDNIVDKPNTVEGYGIIDLYNKDEIDEKYASMQNAVTEINQTASSLVSFKESNHDDLCGDVQTTQILQESLIASHRKLLQQVEYLQGLAEQLQALLS